MADLEEFFRTLLANPRETKSRDNKGAMEWPAAKTEGRFDLLADIMAFSNARDGGTIMFGIENSTHAPVGLTQAQVSSFDKSNIFEAMKTYASPVPDFDLERCEIDNRWFVAIVVKEFRVIPTVCSRDAQIAVPGPPAKQKNVLRAGAVYVRTDGAQTIEINSEQLMRDLIELATRRRGEDLLRQIADLLPETMRGASKPPAVNPYASDIEAARRDLSL